MSQALIVKLLELLVETRVQLDLKRLVQLSPGAAEKQARRKKR
jgi:hypothetical protein